MRDFGEQVKTVALLAANGLGQQLAGQVCGIHPMTRIRLGEIHVGLVRQTTDLRQAVGAYANHPAPLVIDFYTGQMREHVEHLRPHVSANVLRVAA